LNAISEKITATGVAAPWLMLLLFLGASALMIWRLERMADAGFESTALGTLIMPYCSGLGNLLFVFVVRNADNAGSEVITNCLVNNVTNMTLLLGLPAAIWGLRMLPKGNRKPARRDAQRMQIHRLSLLLSLTAVFFFTGAIWALGRDGTLDFGDGLVLVGLFVFWQCFQVYDVLKHNVQRSESFSPWRVIDLVALGAGAFGVYVSLEWIVGWMTSAESGFFNADRIGWITGWLMVVPNAMLALFYAWRKRAEIVYASQIGDGHICIPLCIGLAALMNPASTPAFFEQSVGLLLAAGLAHALLILLFRGAPRWTGIALIALYAWFVATGFA
jgi:cation:H+ antiporter